MLHILLRIGVERMLRILLRICINVCSVDAIKDMYITHAPYKDVELVLRILLKIDIKRVLRIN